MTKSLPKVCRCVVGRHPRRQRIEERLAAGESGYEVAAAYGINRESIRVHWARHVPQRVKDELIRRANALKPAEEIERATADAAVAPLELCARKIPQLEADYHALKAAGQWELAMSADRRQQAWSEYQSKLTGPLRKRDLVVAIQNNFGDDRREFERKALEVTRRRPDILLRDF